MRARAEDRPGVYRMYGSDDRLLYVGKSVRVRSRVLSYFNQSPRTKPGELIRNARRIEWEYVPNEFGALVREMRLIQLHRPRYNVQHKRKRRYAFVKVTREPAPRVVPVGRVAADDALYFGPFPRTRRVAETVRELSYVLGLRDCPSTTPVFFDDQLEIFAGGRAPRCLRGDLGTCLAPCCGRPDARTYVERVRMARRYLEGRKAGVVDLVRARMAEAAGRADFEHAATLRDRADRLEAFRDRLTAWRGEVEGLTFVYRVPGFRGADRVYLVRGGRVAAEADHPKSRAARREVAGLVERTFGEPERGPRGLDALEAAEILFVAAWFRRRPKELKRTLPPDEWLERKGPGPPAEGTLRPPRSSGRRAPSGPRRSP